MIVTLLITTSSCGRSPRAVWLHPLALATSDIASLLRLATAVLMETDEEWQSQKRYLPQTTPPSAS